MSDQLTAAAAALNAPESIVQRSAEARAKATGASIDDVLAAWAGGGAAPAAAPPPTEAPAPEPTPDQPADDQPAPEEPAGEESGAESTAGRPEAAPAEAAPAAAGQAPAAVAVAPVGPATPPILETRSDRPFLVAIGAVAALALSLVAGLVVASTPEEETGLYTSAVPLTSEGEAGRTLYLELGCGACHTQMVRPLVVDAGLGGVTISDSNQVLGSRRFGPDLTDVASRTENAGRFAAVVAGEGGHPTYTLSDADVAGLVAYLSATNALPTEDEEPES